MGADPSPDEREEGRGHLRTGLATQDGDGPDDDFAALVDDPFQSGLLTGEAVNRSALTVAEIDLATLRVVAVSDAGAALVGLER